MKRAGKNLLWGALGLATAAVIAVALNAPAQYEPWAYHYFRGDYEKVGEVYDLAIAHPYRVEHLFMGSSHTFNGVDDGLINRALGPGAAYNAAIPTSGRDFEYAVLKRIFEQSAPKRLYVEVRETEERTSHFGFPIVAPLGEVLSAPPNPWWIKNAFLAVQNRFERLTWLVPALRREELSATRFVPTGYRPNTAQMERGKLSADARDMLTNKRWRLLPAAFGDLEFQASQHYLRAIAELCAAHGTELHFIHLPFLGAPAEPMQADFYRSLGSLHTLPDGLRNDVRYFTDPTHFNPEGAKAYTNWLISDVLTRRALRKEP